MNVDQVETQNYGNNISGQNLQVPSNMSGVQGLNNVQMINLPSNLPLDVSTELAMYSKIFISKGLDYFRVYHCYDRRAFDYTVYGELPDGDKKILFTVRNHFRCSICDCSQVILDFIFCQYACCDLLFYQLDYKRNNNNFYTHGVNLKKGCYCCELDCLPLCCGWKSLYLRENVEPDNPDFDVGIKKGKTMNNTECCCQDKKVKYVSQEGIDGHTLRASYCDVCLNSACSTSFCYCCYFCCCGSNDIIVEIEKPEGNKVGEIFVPNGCYSKTVQSCLYCPVRHFEINLPQNISSLEKFQIIAEAIHFDLDNAIL